MKDLGLRFPFSSVVATSIDMPHACSMWAQPRPRFIKFQTEFTVTGSLLEFQVADHGVLSNHETTFIFKLLFLGFSDTARES